MLEIADGPIIDPISPLIFCSFPPHLCYVLYFDYDFRRLVSDIQVELPSSWLKSLVLYPAS